MTSKLYLLTIEGPGDAQMCGLYASRETAERARDMLATFGPTRVTPARVTISIHNNRTHGVWTQRAETLEELIDIAWAARTVLQHAAPMVGEVHDEDLMTLLRNLGHISLNKPLLDANMLAWGDILRTLINMEELPE